MKTSIPLAAVLLLCALPAAAGELLRADGSSLPIAMLKAGPDPATLELTRPEGEPLRIPLSDLLVLDFARPGGFSLPPNLLLQNGDRVLGNLSFPAPGQVQVAAGWGVLTAPLEWCRMIRLAPAAPTGPAGLEPGLLLKNDRLNGSVRKVVDGKAHVEVGGRVTPLDLGRIQALVMPPRVEKPQRTGTVVLADLGGGERLTGVWQGIAGDIVRLRLDWGAVAEIPVASIARLEVKNGRLVYLSDLEPAEARQTPYFDGEHPYRRDESVTGGMLRLGGRTFSRGLGTQSRTELTYLVRGEYARFKAILGIDDSVGASGSVVFRVYGDDRRLYESPLVRGGDRPIPISLDLTGVLLLRLEVDYGDEGDAADLADWVDASLLRK